MVVRMPDRREAAGAPDFNAIRISVASPHQIKAWSWGEVQKGETINYRTQRPEKDGLFCEKIFGPTKDWECQCGKFKRQKFNGVVCDRCGVEVTRAKVRRERMGHIELAAPVANIWFVKNTPSVMSLALDMKLSELTRVLYYSAYVITEVDIDLMRGQLEQHGAEVETLRNEAVSVAAAARLNLARRIVEWEHESRRADAARVVGEMPEAVSVAAEGARNALADLATAFRRNRGDYGNSLNALAALASVGRGPTRR